ncbi:MAG: DUF4293 domain-containing protein [Cyclobacteriaceae bacterium]
MIQRVQTIFMFLVAVAMILMIFFPLWEKVAVDQSEKMEMYSTSLMHYQVSPEGNMELFDTKNIMYIALIAGVVALLSLYNIFQYRNRQLQMKIGTLCAFLIMAALAITAIKILGAERLFDPEQKGTYNLGFFAPALALILNSFAVRFIKKDEKLVKSVDRIR